MRYAALILGALALGACAPQPIDPAVIRNASRDVRCMAGDDCEVKWAKALRWVLDHSTWKIQTQTDLLISTYGPGDEVFLAYQITKEPLGNGVYEIRMEDGCGNPFGCYPDPLAAKADFVETVMGPAPAGPPPAPDSSGYPDLDAYHACTGMTGSAWAACYSEHGGT